MVIRHWNQGRPTNEHATWKQRAIDAVAQCEEHEVLQRELGKGTG
jgi:hypothetical protein